MRLWTEENSRQLWKYAYFYTERYAKVRENG